VLVHDAMYTEAELSAHRGWGHSSALEATRFAMECVAGLLVLFHHHPDRSDEQMDAIVQECRELVAYSGSSLRVIAAWEGLTLTV
jgi:ribonuclease BN (tRNA processing enzyme)